MNTSDIFGMGKNEDNETEIVQMISSPTQLETKNK